MYEISKFLFIGYVGLCMIPLLVSVLVNHYYFIIIPLYLFPFH